MKAVRVFTLMAFCLAAVITTITAEAERYPDRRAVRAPVVTASGTSGAVSRKTMVDLLLQIDRLQQQVRKLRNDVEVLNFEIKRLKKRQRALLEDIDRRVTVLERGATPATRPATAGSTPGTSTGGVPVRRSSASSSVQEQKQYDAAFSLMRQGYYTRAAKAFRQFITKYPDSTLADNAQYWLGEANYHVRNFKKALVEFQKVVNNYPRSRKFSDALLKIGYTYFEIGDWKRARQTLQEVIRRFPNTANAKSAQIRLNRMKREGH